MHPSDPSPTALVPGIDIRAAVALSPTMEPHPRLRFECALRYGTPPITRITRPAPTLHGPALASDSDSVSGNTPRLSEIP